jgi:hypothetical protein
MKFEINLAVALHTLFHRESAAKSSFPHERETRLYAKTKTNFSRNMRCTVFYDFDGQLEQPARARRR